MKVVFGLLLILIGFTSNAQSKLGQTKEEIRKECREQNIWVDTVTVNGNQEMVMKCRSWKAVHTFDNLGICRVSSIFVTDDVFGLYLTRYNSKYSRMDEKSWLAKFPDYSCRIDLITTGRFVCFKWTYIE